MSRKRDKRAPTLLQTAQLSEQHAKTAMLAAKESYARVKAAWEAIGVVVAELERQQPEGGSKENPIEQRR